ncbi:unnamed protein product, partial [Closterium sp. Naga37s-1]
PDSRTAGLSLPYIPLLCLDPPPRPQRVLALQDCLYRTSLSSAWTLPFDLREHLSALLLQPSHPFRHPSPPQNDRFPPCKTVSTAPPSHPPGLFP